MSLLHENGMTIGSDYKNQRVFVTGAGGFIASHLVEALVSSGAKVRYLDVAQLMQRLMDKGENELCLGTDRLWLNIGPPADYEKALEVFQERRSEFLGDSACGS